MQMSQSTAIDASPEKVWQIISDIDNAEATIEGILKINVLERPKGSSLKGLKWEETRIFAGREAMETMWITDSRKNKFYETRAESHGAIYKSRMEIAKDGAGSTLTMSFDGEAVTFGAKVMWALTGWMAKKPMQKAIAADLADIKAAAESL